MVTVTGYDEAMFCLKTLSSSPRLTKYERDAIRYALAVMEEEQRIERTFYSEGLTLSGG